MKLFEENIKKIQEGISMTNDEREVIRSRLEAYILSNPRREISPVPSKFFFFQRHVLGGAFVVVLVLLSGSASAFAEFALPGDTLYPFKTSVNEQVRGWLSFTDLSKAEWSVELAYRRLSELEQVEKKEAIPSEIKQSLESNLDIQIDRAEDTTKEFEEKIPKKEKNLPVATTLDVSTNSEVSSLEVASPEASLRKASLSSEMGVSSEIVPQIPTKGSFSPLIKEIRLLIKDSKKLGVEKGKVLYIEARFIRVQKAVFELERSNGDKELVDYEKLEEKLIDIKEQLLDLVEDSSEVLDRQTIENPKEQTSDEEDKKSELPKGDLPNILSR